MFISDESGMYYTAVQNMDGSYTVSSNSQPYPIKYNPSNLLSSSIEFATNTKYFSLNRSISYPLDFIKDGAAILRSLYYTGKGVEQKAYLTVIEWNGDLGIFQLSYTGKFDFYQKKDQPKINTFTVNTVDDSAWGVLSLNDTVQYSVPCNASNPNAVKVLVDGITLVNKYNYQTVQSDIVNSSMGNWNLCPFVLINQDGDSSGIVAANQSYSAGTTPPDTTTTGWFFTSVYTLNNVNIYGTFKFDWHSNVLPSGGIDIFFQSSLGQKLDIFSQLNGGLIVGKTYSIDFDFNINLASGENLFLYVQLNDNVSRGFKITPIITNIFIVTKTTPQPQVVYALRPLDLVQELVLKGTNSRYSINSNFLTLNNKRVITSGDSLRGLTDAMIYSSFEDFFKSYNSFYFLAMRVIEGELWIEPAIDVYKMSTAIMDVGEFIDFSLEPAIEYYFKEISVGSPKVDYRHSSGRLEFNSTNTFSTPILLSSKKLDLVSKYRTGCYDIIFLILDYLGNSTKDNSGDKTSYVLDITDIKSYAVENIETFENITVDNAPLAPIIKYPLDNDYIQNTNPRIKGVAPIGSTVNIYADTALDGSCTADSNGNWVYDIVTTLTPYVLGVHTGIHVIDATYTDESAPKTTVTLNIDTRSNQATLITYPAPGDSLYDNKPFIKGAAQAGTNVDIYLDGVHISTQVADGSCKWQIDSSTFPLGYLPNGNNTLQAVSTGQSNSISIDINSFTDYPIITKVNGFNDGVTIINSVPLVEGVGTPGTIVTLYIDYDTRGVLGNATIDINGNWSIQLVNPTWFNDPTIIGSGNVVLIVPLSNGLHIISTQLVNKTVNINEYGYTLDRPAYSTITGVTDNTVFNTKISPKRMLMNNAPLIAPMYQNNNQEEVYFQTGDKNINLVTSIPSEGTISERANVLANQLGQPLFMAEYLVIKTKVPKTFNEILYNFNNGGYIRGTWKGQEILALPIGNMKMAYITDEVQEWKLLMAPSNTYQSLLDIYKQGLKITLMQNSLYHSDYNSLHMVAYDYVRPNKFNTEGLYDDWFENRNEQWILNPGYIQKFQVDETITDQIITNGLRSVELVMYRCSDNKLIDTIPYSAISTPPIPLPDIVLEAKVNFNSYPTDQYYFVIKVAGTPVIISERVESRVKWEDTILIESNNSINLTGCFFSTGFKTILRVEGMVEKLQPDLDTTVFKDEIGDTGILYAVNARKRTIRFGDAYGIPDYLYLKIADTLALDGLEVEGVSYSLDKDEKIEPADIIDGHPLYYYNVKLHPTMNQKGLTSPVAYGDARASVVLVVDAAAFGMPTGSLVNISLDNQ